MAESGFRDLERALFELVAETAVKLPGDVEEAIRRAAALEEREVARVVYRAYLDNVEVARSRRLPLCQDTGVPEFFLWLGERFPHKRALLRAVERAVARAVEEGYLRLNSRDPVTWAPLKPSRASGFPLVHVVDIIEGYSGADLALYLAGGGASRASLATVLDPSSSLEDVAELVAEAIVERASRACPPLVVGVGLASTIESAALNSKLALLRPLGSRSERRDLAALEEAVVETGNALGLGPQSLGGAVTVLDAHVVASSAHPSALAVAVSFSCWALRRSRARVSENLEVEVVPYVYGGV
ncbi:MAG: fumarate hydratase [Acidilobaceae archaeon]